jgi:RNA polymerase sigma-70 factor, ECF subfamily
LPDPGEDRAGKDVVAGEEMAISVAERVVIDPPREEEQRSPPSVRERDHEFDRAIAEHLPVLKKKARQLCRGHADADDIVNDAVERACKAWQQLRDLAQMRGWLLKIVFNTFMDTKRRDRNRPTASSVDAAAAVPEPEPTEALPWEDISDDDVRAAIGQLSEDVRDTYSKFALDGLPYTAIARRLDIPQATVGTRIHRARKQLRVLLKRRLEGQL